MEDDKWQSSDAVDAEKSDRRRASSSSLRPSSGVLLYSNRGKKSHRPLSSGPGQKGSPSLRDIEVSSLTHLTGVSRIAALSLCPGGRGGGMSGAISHENVSAALKEREEELTRRTLV